MLRLKRGIPVWEKGKKSMGCNKGGICPEVKVDKESQKKDSRFYLTGFINSEVEGTIFHSFLSYAQSDWKLFLDWCLKSPMVTGYWGLNPGLLHAKPRSSSALWTISLAYDIRETIGNHIFFFPCTDHSLAVLVIVSADVAKVSSKRLHGQRAGDLQVLSLDDDSCTKEEISIPSQFPPPNTNFLLLMKQRSEEVGTWRRINQQLSLDLQPTVTRSFREWRNISLRDQEWSSMVQHLSCETLGLNHGTTWPARHYWG